MKPIHVLGFFCAIPIELAAFLVYAWWRGNREAQEQERERLENERGEREREALAEIWLASFWSGDKNINAIAEEALYPEDPRLEPFERFMRGVSDD